MCICVYIYGHGSIYFQAGERERYHFRSGFSFGPRVIRSRPVRLLARYECRAQFATVSLDYRALYRRSCFSLSPFPLSCYIVGSFCTSYPTILGRLPIFSARKTHLASRGQSETRFISISSELGVIGQFQKYQPADATYVCLRLTLETNFRMRVEMLYSGVMNPFPSWLKWR